LTMNTIFYNSSLLFTSHWRMISEILILWFVFYRIMLFLKDTKAVYLLRGIVILIIAFFVFQKIGFDTLNWILAKIFAISVIALTIIFQPELRQGLVRLGRQQLFYTGFREAEAEALIKEVCTAVDILAQAKIGALIAIQREIGLKNYIESGIRLDANISSEIIRSIFVKDSPLHDGGVIIAGEKIVAATCLFPLSDNANLDRALGMRHRAGIGLSEETDAVVIIVSEERGVISLAVGGRLTSRLSKNDLAIILKGLIKRRKKK